MPSLNPTRFSRLLAVVPVFFIAISLDASAADSIFPDKALEDAVRQQVYDKRNNDEPLTKEDVKNVAVIFGEDRGIKSLEGLQHCLVVQEIRLSGNEIEDISPLAGLKELLSLDLAANKIADISALKELKRLQYLNLNDNRVQKLDALAELSNMRSLYLNNNKIERLGKLKQLTKLWSLYVSGNPLQAAAVLRRLEMVDTLDLSNCGLKSVDFIKPMKRLKLLDLSGNQLESLDALVALAEANKPTAQFLRVDISDNPLSAKTVKAELKQLDEMRVRVSNEKSAKDKADKKTGDSSKEK